MQNLLKSVPESVRRAISAAVPLLIVIILFVIVGKFGISKVLGVRTEIASAQKVEKTLTQKLNLLQVLSPDIASKANMVASAVPDSNPSLAVISQLKILALNMGVILSAIKSGSGAINTSGLNEANISFALDGVKPQIFAFLNETVKIAPITIIDKIKMTETNESVKADVSIKSFWVEFPKTIPSVSSPITDLTAAEKEILTNLSGLIQPTFTEVAPSQGDINTNPFGQ